MPDYDFEHFPRRDLSFKMSRRGLWQTAVLEMEVYEGQAQGGAGYKLANLGSLPDAAIAQIIPLVLPNCRITVADEVVYGQLPGTAHTITLFPCELATLCAFNQMNGRIPLDEIGRYVAAEMEWLPERAFAFVRGVFLHLVQVRVCVPQGQRG